jgi:hypothetical protein
MNLKEIYDIYLYKQLAYLRDEQEYTTHLR